LSLSPVAINVTLRLLPNRNQVTYNIKIMLNIQLLHSSLYAACKAHVLKILHYQEILLLTLSNFHRFSKFFHCWKEYFICNKDRVMATATPFICCCTTVGSEKGSNLLQIWKTMQTKCIDFTCTYFNGSCLLTYYLLIYYVSLWFLLNIYSYK